MSERLIGEVQMGVQYSIEYSDEFKNEGGTVVKCKPETTIRIERFTRGTIGTQSMDEVTEAVELTREEFEQLVGEIARNGWKPTK